MSSRFLVIAPQGLGDSLEATPLVHAIRLARPASTIDVLVLRSPARQLFEALRPMVSEVIYLPFWEGGSLSFLRELAKRRWRRIYDATLLCYPAARPEYQVLSAAFPSRRRYGHRYAAPAFGSMLWLQQTLVPVRSVHNVLRNMDLLSAAGIPWTTPDAYVIPAAWMAHEERNHRFVALHVGSIAHDGLDSRRWPVDRFASVATRLADAGYDVRAIAGPSELRETEELRSREPRVGVIKGELPAIAAILSTAALTVANDNGIAHLSAAVRTPTISLFGPTPLEHAPFGPESIPLRPSGCPPCFDVRLLNTGCARNIDFACIREELTPELVLESALRVLEPKQGMQA